MTLSSEANSRSALSDADDTVELSVELNVESAQRSEGCRRISLGVGVGGVVVPTAGSLTVGDDVRCVDVGSDVRDSDSGDVVRLMSVAHKDGG